MPVNADIEECEKASDVAADEVQRQQIEFYINNRAGCAFAALAAKNPSRYGWKQIVLSAAVNVIRVAIEESIRDPLTSTVSLIFPAIKTKEGLLALLHSLEESGHFRRELDTEYETSRCVGLRALIGDLKSWVTGFGPFSFLPKTRQAPFTEIAFRVKPRPDYKVVMNKAPDDVIHLADLDLLGDLTWAGFQTLWKSSLRKTAELLGHAADLRSATKTTFALPL